MRLQLGEEDLILGSHKMTARYRIFCECFLITWLGISGNFLNEQSCLSGIVTALGNLTSLCSTHTQTRESECTYMHRCFLLKADQRIQTTSYYNKYKMQFKELTLPIYYYLRTETLEHDIISCFFMHILVYISRSRTELLYVRLVKSQKHTTLFQKSYRT